LKHKQKRKLFTVLLFEKFGSFIKFNISFNCLWL